MEHVVFMTVWRKSPVVVEEPSVRSVPEDVAEGVEQTAEHRHQHQLAGMTEEFSERRGTSQ